MLGRTRLGERGGKLKKTLSGTGTAGICKQGACLSFSSFPPPPPCQSGTLSVLATFAVCRERDCGPFLCVECSRLQTGDLVTSCDTLCGSTDVLKALHSA